MSVYDSDDLFADLLDTLNKHEATKRERQAKPKSTIKTFDKIPYGSTFSLFGNEYFKLNARLREDVVTGERKFTCYHQPVVVWDNAKYVTSGKPIVPQLLEY